MLQINVSSVTENKQPSRHARCISIILNVATKEQVETDKFVLWTPFLERTYFDYVWER